MCPLPSALYPDAAENVITSSLPSHSRSISKTTVPSTTAGAFSEPKNTGTMFSPNLMYESAWSCIDNLLSSVKNGTLVLSIGLPCFAEESGGEEDLLRKVCQGLRPSLNTYFFAREKTRLLRASCDFVICRCATGCTKVDHSNGSNELRRQLIVVFLFFIFRMCLPGNRVRVKVDLNFARNPNGSLATLLDGVAQEFMLRCLSRSLICLCLCLC